YCNLYHGVQDGEQVSLVPGVHHPFHDTQQVYFQCRIHPQVGDGGEVFAVDGGGVHVLHCDYDVIGCSSHTLSLSIGYPDPCQSHGTPGRWRRHHARHTTWPVPGQRDATPAVACHSPRDRVATPASTTAVSLSQLPPVLRP